MSIVQKIIACVRERGLDFVVYEPAEINLRVPAGKDGEVTASLLKAIKAFKNAIVEELKLIPVPKPKGPAFIASTDAENEEIDEAVRLMESRMKAAK